MMESRMLHDAHCDQPGSFDTALGLHPNDPKDRSSMEALIRAQVLGGKWFVYIKKKPCFFFWGGDPREKYDNS